jgi:thymidylate kinase
VISMAPPSVPTAAQLPALTIPDSAMARGAEEAQSRTLLEQLAVSLEARGVIYCQWKGHWSAHRWATGHGDVDLLVGRETLNQFREVVGSLGFKSALPGAARDIPGVETYFGYDPSVSRLLHLHVHYHLLLGEYWRPVYRIPVERPMLESSVPGQLFRAPSPTYQFLIFVLRMMLRQVGRPQLSAQKRWINGIQIQLGSLEACSNRDELASVLRQHLPAIDLAFFDRCVRSLQVESSRLERALLPLLLHRRLRSHSRRPPAAALLLAAAEKFLPARLTHLTGSHMRLAGGGIVVALVGGDGAGKSTCAGDLTHWLSPAFPALRGHLGNPPRSSLTLLVGGALKLQHWLDRRLRRTSNPNGLIASLRHLCLARDRFRLYVRVQRHSARGGIAICERYPVPQNRALVGPSIAESRQGSGSWVMEKLRLAETAYYERLLRPDLLCVLRLDPELAVARKPEEPADYVRTRNQIIWDTDWSSTTAHVVDASQPLESVIRRLKAIIWSAL